jgi:hypothetical protein
MGLGRWVGGTELGVCGGSEREPTTSRRYGTESAVRRDETRYAGWDRGTQLTRVRGGRIIRIEVEPSGVRSDWVNGRNVMHILILDLLRWVSVELGFTPKQEVVCQPGAKNAPFPPETL